MMKALKEAAPIQIENKYESIEIKVKHKKPYSMDP